MCDSVKEWNPAMLHVLFSISDTAAVGLTCMPHSLESFAPHYGSLAFIHTAALVRSFCFEHEYKEGQQI
jgi:hypothetical protein